jgi:hypothetical protein
VSNRSANINSPEVIKHFRNHFVEFDTDCRNALEGMRSDVRKVLEWLRHEQAPYWKQQLRKREELVERAKREYFEARNASELTRKASCVDEKKALDRANRMKEEAEGKIEAVKSWLMTAEHKVAKLMQPCVSLGSLLESMTPQALARMDQMLDRLDEYLRDSTSGPSV